MSKLRSLAKNHSVGNLMKRQFDQSGGKANQSDKRNQEGIKYHVLNMPNSLQNDNAIDSAIRGGSPPNRHYIWSPSNSERESEESGDL